MSSTRSKSQHLLFSFPAELPVGDLPTYRDVGSLFLLRKERKNASNKDSIAVVADEVMSQWSKASIPTIAKRSVVRKIRQLIDEAAKVTRSSFNKDKSRAKLEGYVDSLFDICSCACENLKSCSCPKAKKVTRFCPTLWYCFRQGSVLSLLLSVHFVSFNDAS
jgi:hypothetical protein